MYTQEILNNLKSRNTKMDKSAGLQTKLMEAKWPFFESIIWMTLSKFFESLEKRNVPVGVIDIRFEEENFEVHIAIDETNNLSEAFDNDSYSDGDDLALNVNWFIQELGVPYEFKMGIALTGFIIELCRHHIKNQSFPKLNFTEPFYIQRGFYSGADSDPYYDSSEKIPCNNASPF